MILISILILIMLLLINKNINNYSITINNDHCSNNFVNNSYNK